MLTVTGCTELERLIALDRTPQWTQDRLKPTSIISFDDGSNFQPAPSKEHAVNRTHSSAHSDAPGDEGHRRILEALHDHGWSEQDNFLPPDLTLSLALECAALAAAGTLALARISQGAARSLQPEVRGDRIHWLEAGQSEACDRYLAIMETLRIELNRRLFLGLEEYEAISRSTGQAIRMCNPRDQFSPLRQPHCVGGRLSECRLAA